MKKSWLQMIKASAAEWNNDKALRLSASLAYYSIFSIAPLLVISLGLAGLVWGGPALAGELHDQLKNYIGEKAADAVQSMVQSASHPKSGVIATIVGFVTLLFGASGVMSELKDALNTVWQIKPKPGSAVMSMIHEKFLNFGMVLVIGFLLMVSLLLSAGVAALSKHLQTFLSLPPFVWAILASLLSFAVITLMIAMIFKLLPDAKIHWSDVWVGALITAALFEGGKTALGWYLGLESTSSAYGAAGSVVLLLLWIYYASCILFFGAEFTQVHAAAYGHFIVPDAHGEPVTALDRVQLGLPVAAVASPEAARSSGDTPPPRMPPPVWRHHMMESILKYLEARGLLLSLEAKEAFIKSVSIVILALVAVIVIFAGWLLLATAFVGWLTNYMGWNWVKAATATGGLHMLLAAGIGVLIWRKFGRTLWFGATINELKEDRLWLRGQTSKH